MSGQILALIRVIDSLATTYGAVYVGSSFSQPHFFLRRLTTGRTDLSGKSQELGMVQRYHERTDEPRAKRLFRYVRIFLCVTSVCILMYHVGYGVFRAVHYSWGGEDEDGTWRSDHEYLVGMFALLGGMFVAFYAESTARTLIKVERHRD